MDENQSLSGGPTATRLLGEKILRSHSAALNELDSD